MSTVYDCQQADSRVAGLTAARGALKSGRLVVMPTDTLYGLAADAFDSSAVTDLLRAKGRGRDMPVPVLVGSWTTIDGLVAERTQAKKDKNFARADEIRDQLKDAGIQLEDTREGTRWSR